MLGELSEFWRRLVVNSIRIVLKVAKSNYLLIRNIYRGIARTNNSGRRSGSEHSFSEARQKYIIHIFCGLCLIKLESKTTMTGSETWKSSSTMVREADEKRKKNDKDPIRPSRPPSHSINIQVMTNHFYLFFILEISCIKLSQYPNKIKIIISSMN